ncbi:hypothetical protein B0H14DRAFT_3549434 [Mycena olivaceomarginata]|nr:hypothetical protein B0H14DRAFT_3549434 [Mycena olivaceomarginata]
MTKTLNPSPSAAGTRAQTLPENEQKSIFRSFGWKPGVTGTPATDVEVVPSTSEMHTQHAPLDDEASYGPGREPLEMQGVTHFVHGVERVLAEGHELTGRWGVHWICACAGGGIEGILFETAQGKITEDAERVEGLSGGKMGEKGMRIPSTSSNPVGSRGQLIQALSIKSHSTVLNAVATPTCLLVEPRIPGKSSLNSGRTRAGANGVNCTCGIEAGGKTLKICMKKIAEDLIILSWFYDLLGETFCQARDAYVRSLRLRVAALGIERRRTGPSHLGEFPAKIRAKST